VRRGLKVAVWTVVFALCAGAGAYVASRTDPFPPGVEDPGARPTPVSTDVTPTPEVLAVWSVSIEADTSHRLHVGGLCTSDWKGSVRLRARADGTLAGPGSLTLVPGSAGCDFSQAQIQTETLSVASRGTIEVDGSIRLRLREAGRDPVGSQDLGGLTATVMRIRPVLTPGEAGLRGRVDTARSDGDLGTIAATYRLTATCRQGCG
jgi:hypothetical protein